MSEEFERVPCDDDMCTGIVGEDGRCGTCHKQCAQAPTRTVSDEISPVEEIERAEEAPSGEPVRHLSETSLDPEERVLCPDGMCTGILSSDGRCGTCGALASTH